MRPGSWGQVKHGMEEASLSSLPGHSLWPSVAWEDLQWQNQTVVFHKRGFRSSSSHVVSTPFPSPTWFLVLPPGFQSPLPRGFWSSLPPHLLSGSLSHLWDETPGPQALVLLRDQAPLFFLLPPWSSGKAGRDLWLGHGSLFGGPFGLCQGARPPGAPGASWESQAFLSLMIPSPAVGQPGLVAVASVGQPGLVAVTSVGQPGLAWLVVKD